MRYRCPHCQAPLPTLRTFVRAVTVCPDCGGRSAMGSLLQWLCAAGLGLLGTAVVLLWRLPEPGPLGAALAFTAGLLALLGGVAALVRPLPYRARKTPEAEP